MRQLLSRCCMMHVLECLCCKEDRVKLIPKQLILKQLHLRCTLGSCWANAASWHPVQYGPAALPSSDALLSLLSVLHEKQPALTVAVPGDEVCWRFKLSVLKREREGEGETFKPYKQVKYWQA